MAAIAYVVVIMSAQTATDQLIEYYRGSGLTPKEAIEVWKQTAEPDAVELCMDCVEALVGVVG